MKNISTYILYVAIIFVPTEVFSDVLIDCVNGFSPLIVVNDRNSQMNVSYNGTSNSDSDTQFFRLQQSTVSVDAPNVIMFLRNKDHTDVYNYDTTISSMTKKRLEIKVSGKSDKWFFDTSDPKYCNSGCKIELISNDGSTSISNLWTGCAISAGNINWSSICRNDSVTEDCR